MINLVAWRSENDEKHSELTIYTICNLPVDLSFEAYEPFTYEGLSFPEKK